MDKDIPISKSSNYNLVYINDPKQNIYLQHFKINKEDEEFLKELMTEDEGEMFKEIKIAQTFGCPMLVMAGLRGVTESLINRICEKENIVLEEIRKDGKKEKIRLTSKYIKIKKFVKEFYCKQLIHDIINKGNNSLHELRNGLERTGSKGYIGDFIIMLKNEEVFKNLNNKKNEPARSTTTN